MNKLKVIFLSDQTSPSSNNGNPVSRTTVHPLTHSTPLKAKQNGRRRWSDADLIEAVANCRSIRQVLLQLQLKPAGGNYAQINASIQRLQLNTQHFCGRRWNHGARFGPKQSLEALLASSTVTSYRLKRRLLSEGWLEARCSCCRNSHWLGGEIPLELDHIDGCPTNNRFNNLRLLCPNCHALTPTYRSRRRIASAHAPVAQLAEAGHLK